MSDPRTMTTSELVAEVKRITVTPHFGSDMVLADFAPELARRLEEAERDLATRDKTASEQVRLRVQAESQRDAALARAERAEAVLVKLVRCGQRIAVQQPAVVAKTQPEADAWSLFYGTLADAEIALAATATTEKEDGNG